MPTGLRRRRGPCNTGWPQVLGHAAAHPGTGVRRVGDHIARCDDTATAQCLTVADIELAQFRPQRRAHGTDPVQLHRDGNLCLLDHIAQRFDVHLRSQGVAFGQHRTQTLRTTDQGIEFGQIGFHSLHGELLNPPEGDTGLDFGLVHEFEFIKGHRRQRTRSTRMRSLGTGKCLQQHRGVAFAQLGLPGAQLLGRHNQGISLLQVATGGLACLQHRARRGNELAHQQGAVAGGTLQGRAVQGGRGAGGHR